MILRKISFWMVIAVGIAGIIASVISYLKGADFASYFLAGFCGITIIIHLIIDERKFNKKRKLNIETSEKMKSN